MYYTNITRRRKRRQLGRKLTSIAEYTLLMALAIGGLYFAALAIYDANMAHGLAMYPNL